MTASFLYRPPFSLRSCVVLVALIAMLCSVGPLLGRASAEQQLVLHKTHLINNQNGLQLLLNCSITDEETVRGLVKDGAVLELAISVVVEGHRSWWSNAAILNKQFTSRLGHNQLTREFTLTLPGKPDAAPLREKNLARLLYKAWAQLQLPLLSPEEVAQLDAQREYVVELDVEFHHVEVPPWLEKNKLFWSSQVAPSVLTEFSFLLPQLPTR